MSIFFSRQCEYALQAVLYLALKPRGASTSIKELTDRLGVPYHFLAKILQSLAIKGLLVSQKGPSGGFQLAQPAEKITLFQIVEAVDGVAFTSSCLLGFSECSGKNPCAVHDQWSVLRTSLSDTLTHKSISEMARDMRKPEYKIR